MKVLELVEKLFLLKYSQLLKKYRQYQKSASDSAYNPFNPCHIIKL
jgi:hypothetical protein